MFLVNVLGFMVSIVYYRCELANGHGLLMMQSTVYKVKVHLYLASAKVWTPLSPKRVRAELFAI